MCFILCGFQQDLDDGEVNYCVVGVIYKDFIVVVEGVKIEKNIGQNGGDYCEILYCQVVLIIKLKDNFGCCKRD